MYVHFRSCVHPQGWINLVQSNLHARSGTLKKGAKNHSARPMTQLETLLFVLYDLNITYSHQNLRNKTFVVLMLF